jgi:hypothetical protein
MHSLNGVIAKDSPKLKALMNEHFFYAVLNGFAFIVDDYRHEEHGSRKKLETLLPQIGVTRFVSVFTDYFGGVGEQGAVFYDTENNIQKESDLINESLRLLGVERSNNIDEFDMCGLGGYRNNEEVIPKEVHMARKARIKAAEDKRAEDDYQEWRGYFDALSDHDRLVDVNSIMTRFAEAQDRRSFHNRDTTSEEVRLIQINGYLTRFFKETL